MKDQRLRLCKGNQVNKLKFNIEVEVSEPYKVSYSNTEYTAYDVVLNDGEHPPVHYRACWSERWHHPLSMTIEEAFREWERLMSK